MACASGKGSAGSSAADQCLLSSREEFKQEKPSTEVPIRDPENKAGVSKVSWTHESSSRGQENAGSSVKRKHSRWDATAQADEQNFDHAAAMAKQRKTRWANDDSQLKMDLPDFATVSTNAGIDSKIQTLERRLLDVNLRLQSQGSIDELQSHAQLHSSYKKLVKRKQKLIRKLVRENATFAKKLYLPAKEYPKNEFINIIIGYRGKTQRRIEKETGAKITICGRGYSNDGKPRQEDGQPDTSDDEDLHVLIEAYSQKSLDATVAMVEGQLLRLQNRKNKLGLSQQKELTEPRGTFKGENTCKIWKMPSKTDAKCEICGDAGHYTVACPFSGRLLQTKAHENDVNIPAAVGGGFPPFTSSPFPGKQPLDFRAAVHSVPLSSDKLNRNVEYTKLHVVHLPQHVDGGRLIQLFSPFGALSYVEVIRDEATGLSKGYGFVEYIDPASAVVALNQMNGYRLDGKILVVQLARHQNGSPCSMQPVEHAGISSSPAFLSSFATATIPAPTRWSGPPGSTLPETYSLMHASYGSSYTSPIPSTMASIHNATSEEYARFPGNPDNFASGYQSLFS